MKKYLSIILAILLVMSALTGCAGKNNPTKLDNYRKLGYYKTYDNL